jgi:hypothetical protein
LALDPYQAEMLIQRLAKAGVPVEATPFVPSSLQGMASAVLETFSNRQIDLWPHEQLLDDLRGLRCEERGYGIRLVSPRGPAGHGGHAT